MRRFTLALACLALLLAPAAHAAELPSPTGTITDLANVLPPDVEQALRARIEAVEQKTSAEIAVAVVPSLDGMSVEEYANRLFHQWGIGQKTTDNGLLLLVATGDRKIRIEVGYGLEPILPDGLAGEIIRTQALPAFRDGHFDTGIRSAVERIATIVEAKHVLTAEERAALDQSVNSRPPMWLMTPFFGLFIAIGAGALGMGARTKSAFPLLFGGLFGGIPLIMSLIPFFNVAIAVIGPIAIGMFMAGWIKADAFFGEQEAVAIGQAAAKRSKHRRKHAKGTGAAASTSSSDSSFSSSSSSSSSWSSSDSSSSSDSGSFSGGDSGGGGASDSW